MNDIAASPTATLETCARNARAGGEGMRAADRKTREAHAEWIESALSQRKPSTPPAGN
jgi:hypothetical protein